MAEPTEPAPAEQPAIPVEVLPGAGGGPRKRHLLLLGAGVVILAAAAGYGAALLGGCADQGPAVASALPPPPPAHVTGTDRPFEYIDLETVTVNLDEPRLARYVRVAVTLAVPVQDAPAVREIIREKMPTLKDWLNTYFVGCTLEDVRGPANLNRMKREILDAFNEQLWPNQKPLINQVLFKELTVV
jgi:flagellar basal body-associated protein FliL